MESYPSKVLQEVDHTTSEEKLWRAVLNQALVDAFGVNTIFMCHHERDDVNRFFSERTEEFDELCEKAGMDATRLWRKVQRLKGVQVGFIIPNKSESKTIEEFNQFKERRNKYIKSHWRNNVGR
jgi:predicted Co/Zn/Cd cation transporter (cation efflux family)